jgi:hypothetical protein
LRDQEETISPVVYDIVFAEAPAFSGNEAVVDVVYNTPGTVRKDKAGTVILAEPEAREVQEQLVLTKSVDGWIVLEVLAV